MSDSEVLNYVEQLKSKGYVVEKKRTSSKKGCFLAHLGLFEHILIIPDRVTRFNGMSRKAKQSEANMALREMQGKLTVFGGASLMTMNCMFIKCKKLSEIDVSHMDNAKVTSMFCMFFDCEGLEQVNLGALDTSKVKDMGYMFANCRLIRTVDMSKQSLYSVISTKFMFFHCFSLTEVKFNEETYTMELKDVSFMFGFCFLLEKINLKAFVTHFTQYFTGMFYSCRALHVVNIRSFRFIPSQLDMTGMFYDCWFDVIQVDVNLPFGQKLCSTVEAFGESVYISIKVTGDYSLQRILN